MLNDTELFEKTEYIIFVNSFNNIEKFLEESNMDEDTIMPVLNEDSEEPVAVFQRAKGESETSSEKLNSSGLLSRFLVTSNSKEAMTHADENGWKDSIWGAVILDNVSNFKLIEYRKVYPEYAG